MANRADSVRVNYADFITLCRVDSPENWAPGLRVDLDGVWVKDIPSDSLLSPEERSSLSEHPDGDPSKPIITFPCTLRDIETRLCGVTGGGYIDAFVMAAFVARKIEQDGLLASKASIGQLNRRAVENEEILRAALAVLWHFPPAKKSATALARQMEEKALFFWRNTSEPPLKTRALTELLSHALTLPEK